MPGLVTLGSGEGERVERMRLVRQGVSPGDIDELDVFDRWDMLHLGAVEMYFEHQQLAKLMAVELAKVMKGRR